VTLEVVDAHPSAASAVSAADAARPDVVFGPYGSGPAVAAAAASAGTIWNHGGATARLARPRYPRVVNVPSPAYCYLAAVLETLVAEGLPAGAEAVLVHVDTGFGREVAEGAAAAARRLGLPMRPITFPPGRVRDIRIPPADVLLSAGSFEDDVAVARLASQHRWRAVGLVAAGVAELRQAIDVQVEGMYGPCQWLADAADQADGRHRDGPDGEWFARRYRETAGSDPPYPAAAAFAAGVIWQRCVADAATADPVPVFAASQRLDTTTLFGRFRVDPTSGVQTGHQIRVVKWEGGQRVAVQ
jgi:ABC-type branched-subunit amino acid transport system substrate-binding protein